MGAVTSYPKIKIDNLFTFVNTWNKVLGKHSFKVGSAGAARPLRQDRTAGPQVLNAVFSRTATTILRAKGVNSNYNSLQVNLTKRFPGA
jgi:hypothetical protein